MPREGDRVRNIAGRQGDKELGQILTTDTTFSIFVYLKAFV